MRQTDTTDYPTYMQPCPDGAEAEDEKTYTIQADSDTVSFKNNGENQF